MDLCGFCFLSFFYSFSLSSYLPFNSQSMKPIRNKNKQKITNKKPKSQNRWRNVKWRQRKSNTEFRNSRLPLQHFKSPDSPFLKWVNRCMGTMQTATLRCYWCGSDNFCSLSHYETIGSSGPSLQALQAKQSPPAGTHYSSTKSLQSWLAIVHRYYLILAFPPWPVTLCEHESTSAWLICREFWSPSSS